MTITLSNRSSHPYREKRNSIGGSSSSRAMQNIRTSRRSACSTPRKRSTEALLAFRGPRCPREPPCKPDISSVSTRLAGGTIRTCGPQSSCTCTVAPIFSNVIISLCFKIYALSIYQFLEMKVVYPNSVSFVPQNGLIFILKKLDRWKPRTRQGEHDRVAPDLSGMR